MAIEGLDRLKNKLTKKIPQAVEKRVREAMEQSANEAVSVMKSFAPVDDGDLQMSISWTWGDAPKGALTLARSTRKSSDGLRITIYAGGGDAYYARFVEFGTQAHTAGGKFAGATIPAIRPQPFFYPGWRLVKKRVTGRVTRNIKKALKEASA